MTADRDDDDADHDTIADRVDRGVACLDYTVEPVTLDVREQGVLEQSVGGGQ